MLKVLSSPLGRRVTLARGSTLSSHTVVQRRCQSQWPFSRGQYQRFGSQSPGSRILYRWAASPYFYYQVGGLGAAAGCVYIYNLDEVPLSHRRRFNVISEAFEEQIAGQLGTETIQQYRDRILSERDPRHQMVQRVLDRLVPQTGLTNKQWEVHVIDDPQKNAFVVPGGKVFVFTGILNVCAGESGVATVLSHEISHTVARHSAERMSKMFAVGGVVLGLLAAFGIDPGISRLILDVGYSRPGSRTQEAEADYMGLLMMAQACYDPRQAISFWERMQKSEQAEPPQFLSTHPSHTNRVGKMTEWLPEAEDRYQASDCSVTAGFARDFRDRVAWGQ